eukprot:COSAG02_NODE_198_length_29564_cov_12.279009_16_plen_290_part_00
MDFASQKARGRGARRSKARHSGVSNADKRAGRGRGAPANQSGAGGGPQAPRGRSRGRGRGRGANDAESGDGGWRSRRSKVPQGATNAWRYEESDASASLFERRTEQGEDINRLLAEQSGAALGAVFPSKPASAGTGELDLCRLAATLSALNPAERLHLDPTLFVAGEAVTPDAVGAAAAARQRRAEELAQYSTSPQLAGGGRGRGRGRGQPDPTGWVQTPLRRADGDVATPAWAGPAPSQGRGRGRGRGAARMPPSPSPSLVAAEPPTDASKGAVGSDTAELDDFLDSL